MAEIDIQPEDQAVFGRLRSTGRITHGLRRVMTQRYNSCSSCDHFIFRGRPAFAGYDEHGTALVVGSCCAGRLIELATPVYWDGALDVSVPDSQPLWRFMDFAKFVAVLRQGGIYFPRADKLEDPFEGATGLARREVDWDKFYLNMFRDAVTTPPSGYSPPEMSEDRIDQNARRLLRSWKAAGTRARSTLVSCWHANSVESEALWRLYCPPPTMGIAVRTSVTRLWEATAADTTAVVGKVHYLDFRSSFANANQRIFCKRLSLSHEREVRATLDNDAKHPTEGRLLPCDLSSLIEQVVISPFAPSWFIDVVKDVIEKFGYDLPLRLSELLEEPFY